MQGRHKFLVSLAFVVVAVLSSSAQSASGNAASSSAVSPVPSQLILTASLNPPALAGATDDSLPDSPSASQQNSQQDTQQNSSAPADQSQPDQSQTDQAQTKQPSSNPQDAPYKGKKYTQHGAPPAAVGGPFEVESRVADKKFWGLTGAMFGASIADVELTHRCEAIGTCSYLPPSMRRRMVMYGVGLPADMAITYFAYQLKRGHHSWWYLPQGVVTGANVIVAMHAYKRATQ